MKLMMMTMMIVMMATVTWIAVVLVFDSFYCCSSFLWVAFHGSHTVSSCACKSGSQCTESSTGGGGSWLYYAFTARCAHKVPAMVQWRWPVHLQLLKPQPGFTSAGYSLNVDQKAWGWIRDNGDSMTTNWADCMVPHQQVEESAGNAAEAAKCYLLPQVHLPPKPVASCNACK